MGTRDEDRMIKVARQIASFLPPPSLWGWETILTEQELIDKGIQACEFCIRLARSFSLSYVSSHLSAAQGPAPQRFFYVALGQVLDSLNLQSQEQNITIDVPQLLTYTQQAYIASLGSRITLLTPPYSFEIWPNWAYYATAKVHRQRIPGGSERNWRPPFPHPWKLIRFFSWGDYWHYVIASSEYAPCPQGFQYQLGPEEEFCRLRRKYGVMWQSRYETVWFEAGEFVLEWQ